MLVKPEYAWNIIVLVSHNLEYNWYVSETDVWLELYDLGVDEPLQMAAFLQEIERYQVTTQELSTLVADKLFIAKDAGMEELLEELSWDAVELFPSLYVSFDEEFLYSMFPEYTSFEDYVPYGWVGRYKDFWSEIPQDMKYWIVDGRDYFAQFGIT